MKQIKLLFVCAHFFLGTALGQQESAKKMKVLYVYDALCGWCYGFSSTFSQFHEKYQNEVAFEVISGGMVTGDRIGPIGEVAPYISWAYKDVEKATGITFGADFLEKTLKEGTAIFTSIPPGIALSVMKVEKPEVQVAFAARLQRAIYFDGMEPKNWEAYGPLASEFGVEGEAFVEKMKEVKFLEAAQREFAMSSQLGVTGFPTIFLVWENKAVPIARGAVSYEVLEQNYQQAKQQLTK
ncbi:MAG: DsbA family protein [Bacteroidota bacterium]